MYHTAVLLFGFAIIFQGHEVVKDTFVFLFSGVFYGCLTVVVDMEVIGTPVYQQFAHLQKAIGSSVEYGSLAILVDMVQVGVVADQKINTLYVVS